MEHKIKVFYSEEDGGYIAALEGMETVSAFGDSPEEALRELRIVLDAIAEFRVGII